MAGTIRPPQFDPFGDQGPNVYLSTDGNPPSHAGDGNFVVGDWIINTVPTAAGVSHWVCTAGGTGATAVFNACVIAA